MAKSTSLIDTLENVTDIAVQDLIDRADLLDRMLGDRPFGQQKLPERSQVRRYSVIRDNGQAWSDLINEHGPGNIVDYALKLEQLSSKYPDELIHQPMPQFPQLQKSLESMELPDGGRIPQ